MELSRKLADISKHNLQKEGIDRVYIFNENAACFERYDEYNYIYMFNPFPDQVMKEVMKKLTDIARKGKKITIVYRNPICHNEVIRSGVFQLYKKYKGKTSDYNVYKSE